MSKNWLCFCRFLSKIFKRLDYSDPQEIKVVALIKDGKISKEISEILNISETTVNFHRKNLRKKLGLKNRRMNLKSYLLSMS